MTSTGVPWSKDASTAGAEPEPSLEAMHPCLFESGPPFTHPVTLHAHALPPAAPTPGLSHKGMHVHTHSCILIHVWDCQGDDEGSDDDFLPKLPYPEAGRRGDLGVSLQVGRESRVHLCAYGLSLALPQVGLLPSCLPMYCCPPSLIILGTSPPTASDSPGQS